MDTTENALSEVWLTTNQVGSLLGVPVSTLKRHIAAGRYTTRRDETDRRAPYQVLLASLPKAAQLAWAQRRATSPTAVKANPFKEQLPLPLAPDSTILDAAPLIPRKPRPAVRPELPPEEYRTLWEAYEKRNGLAKRRAERACDAVIDYFDLRATGVSVAMAEKAVEAKHGVKRVTLWRYREAVAGHPREHWLPLLAPKYIGQGQEAEFSIPAYEWILARFLSTSEPKGEVIVKEARKEGAGKGWIIPSTKTVLRHLAKEPAWLTKLGRAGEATLESSYPAVERDYESLKLHEVWESDGRRADVFCVWPDGSVGRPFIVVWREVRTRLVLAVRGYRNPTGELVMACYRMALERSGATPQYAKIDNGREYANKAFTGQQKTRYRFKIQPGEPIGILTRMGTKAWWSKPGRGQDKPVESFWRYVADHCDKAAEFQGAYCGRNPVARPEDFDPKKAVPVAAYGAKLAAVIEEFNHRPHRGNGMHGRSPLDVYAELLPLAEVRQPDPAHLRLLLLAVTTLQLNKEDASIRFKVEGFGECRYWSKALAELPLPARQKGYQVYFDPESPMTPVAIYDGDVFVCEAAPIDRIPFMGGDEAAAAHATAKLGYMAPKKKALKAIKNAAPLALPDMTQPAELTPLPQPNQELLIEAPRPARAPEPESQLEPLPGEANAWRDSRTGEIIRKPTPARPQRTGQLSDEELEELERQQREKRAAAREAERKRRFG